MRLTPHFMPALENEDDEDNSQDTNDMSNAVKTLENGHNGVSPLF